MVITLNNCMLIFSVILLVSVIVSKSSNKFGLPILIVFLAMGMVFGSEGMGLLQYENYELTHSISLIAICLIIFSGGLMTKKEDIKPIIKSGISLSTLGVLLTTAFVGTFCFYYLNLPIFESLLVGAILSATDAAAVFTAFRDKNSQVTKNVKNLLEFESGSNDPMAYLLVTLFLGLSQNKYHLDLASLKLIVLNPVVGIIGGYLAYKSFKTLNDSTELDFQGLYPAMTIGFVFLTYSLTTKLNGNGFLAVYIFAVQIANTKILHKKALINFFDGIAWLSQIGLFIMLGLLVFPSRLLNIAPQAIVVSFFLIFVGRPLSVFLSTLGSKLSFKGKIFVSWGGLKGATPIVFASLVATEVGSEANLIFDIVFFTVLVSAILQGTTLRFFAKKFNLFYEAVVDPDFPVDLEVINKTKNGIKELHLTKTDFAVNHRIVDLNLPSGTLALFIKRAGSFIIPKGSTVFEPDDKVLIVTPDKDQIEIATNHFKTEHSFDNILEFTKLLAESETEDSENHKAA